MWGVKLADGGWLRDDNGRVRQFARENDALAMADVRGGEHRRLRGFATMDRRLVSEIASKGGRAAHEAGTAHEFTNAEARAAGRKGGTQAHANARRRAEAARKGRAA